MPFRFAPTARDRYDAQPEHDGGPVCSSGEMAREEASRKRSKDGEIGRILHPYHISLCRSMIGKWHPLLEAEMG